MATGACSRLFANQPVVASWVSCFAALALVWGTKVQAQAEANRLILPLGLLHYLVLNRKKQLEQSKASHRHGVPIPLVILLGRVDRCSRTKPESYQFQSKGRPRSPAW